MRYSTRRAWGGFETLLALLAIFLTAPAHATEARLLSPDGRLAVALNDDDGPAYALTYDGRPILSRSRLGLALAAVDAPAPAALRFGSMLRRTHDARFRLTTSKVDAVRDHYNEVGVDLVDARGGSRLRLLVRAYDEGVALRYVLAPEPAPAAIAGEITEFNFPEDFDCWGLNLGTFVSGHEGEYDLIKASQMRSHNRFDAPLTCGLSKGGAFAIAEADVQDFAGLYLGGRFDGALGVVATLSPTPADRFIAVRRQAGREMRSPWRVVMVARHPGKLIESTLMLSLSTPPEGDFSWVRPGKTSWDWWSGYAVEGVAKPGVNQATALKFIDFSATSGFEYMLLDSGWYVGSSWVGGQTDADVTRSTPDIDVPALVAYARDRRVGVWLWVQWHDLDRQLDKALSTYRRWGIKGIKIDFMERDDQEMFRFFHRLLRSAAKHQLMVNLHGMTHPTGLHRTYPNLLTQEGVFGAEMNKYTARVTSAHNVTIPYTRMLLGPMDYTPGGFRNVEPEDFIIRERLPLVKTTRGHALAMYVVYESALASISDAPSAYRGQPGFDFLQSVPVVWDETRFLAGDVGKFVVLARRKGRDWYIGAMTNEEPRSVELSFDFLGPGAYRADIREDGKTPADLLRRELPKIDNDHRTVLRLKANGGAVVTLTRLGTSSAAKDIR